LVLEVFMKSQSDKDLSKRIAVLLGDARIPVDVEVRNGTVTLTGRVDSMRMRQAAIDLARSVDGVAAIDDQIDLEVISPDTAFEPLDDDQQFDYADRESLDDDISDTEPTFEGSSGAAHFQEAIEEARPYFPPTDPVVRPVTDEEELEVLGGYEGTSMDELVTDPDLEPSEEAGEPDVFGPRHDGDIQRDVTRELREDAYTSDMPLEVEVVNGVVHLRGRVQSVEDAEYAEGVAGRVPGVVEVRDLTEVE
jgi:osmotically-inducible protein OsmY